MADIRAFVGMSGSAKSLCMSNTTWGYWLQGYRIYSNYDLIFDGNNKPWSARYAARELNYTPLFHPRDLLKIKLRGKLLIVLDEIDNFGSDPNDLLGGVDAYDFKSESARLTSAFFKKRLRKLHGKLFYTVQQMRMVPPRVREETEFLDLPEIVRTRLTGDPVHPVAPLVVIIKEKRINPESPGGEFRDTGMARRLCHPILGIGYVTPDMLQIYNTDGDILSTQDLPSKPGNPFAENAVNDEKFFHECQKHFGIDCVVELLQDSGNNSQWIGDVVVTPPGQAPLIFDVTGVHKYYKNGSARYLNLAPKWEKLKEMLQLDAKIGSVHYLAYYEFEGDKQIWNVIPVSRLKNALYSPAYLLPSSKIITGSKNLKVPEIQAIPLTSLSLSN
jgi:hypothetical protein